MASSNVGNNDTNISFMSWLFSPKGRIDRDGYRLRAVPFGVATLGTIFLVPLLTSNELIYSIAWVITIPMWVIFATGTIKRMHDLNRSGGWTLLMFLLMFVPFVFFIPAFVCGNFHGDGLAENRYGYRKRWKSWIPG
jgi:uncharacterized membrane protein YhaH (DUF805 family)